MSYSFSYDLCLFCLFLLARLCLSFFLSFEVAESAHQIIPKLNYFLSLLLHVLCVALVRNFDNGGGGRRLQKRFLELNLVQEKLVCVMGWQTVLALDRKEVLGRDWLVGVLNEHLDQLRGRRRCHIGQLNFVLVLRCPLVVLSWMPVGIKHAVFHECLNLVPVGLSPLIILKAQIVFFQLGTCLRRAWCAGYSWCLFFAFFEWRGILTVTCTALLASSNACGNLAQPWIYGRRNELLLHAHWAGRPVVICINLWLQAWILNKVQLVSVAWNLWIKFSRVSIQRAACAELD